jgi:hypothetical protein
MSLEKRIIKEKMQLSSHLSFLLLLLASCSLAQHCSAADRQIFLLHGSTFESRFRELGGITVTRPDYEASIISETGLSRTCASCYGTAYICGWQHCFWACRSASSECTSCLGVAKCIEHCNECTGFLSKKDE